MVKECHVIINNECVTVVRYDGIDIQLPSIGKDAKSVLIIKHVNGSYQIADSAEPVDAIDNGEQSESQQAEASAKVKSKKQSKHQMPKKPSRLYRV